MWEIWIQMKENIPVRTTRAYWIFIHFETTCEKFNRLVGKSNARLAKAISSRLNLQVGITRTHCFHLAQLYGT
jgi:hypothetical protein